MCLNHDSTQTIVRKSLEKRQEWSTQQQSTCSHLLHGLQHNITLKMRGSCHKYNVAGNNDSKFKCNGSSGVVRVYFYLSNEPIRLHAKNNVLSKKKDSVSTSSSPSDPRNLGLPYRSFKNILHTTATIHGTTFLSSNDRISQWEKSATK